MSLDIPSDPLDYERSCIWEHARDSAVYCEIVMKLIELGKDHHAKANFDLVLSSVGDLKLHFTSLGKGLMQRKLEEDAAREKRMVKAREIAERRAKRSYEGADAADA